jgi:HAD superfamily hydrolase (TIGR01509 family)
VAAIFLDAAGVLLDTTVMPAQWQRHVAEYLVPRLGGTPEAWAEANAWAAERLWARYRDPGGTPNETHGRLRRLWVREMCERVGVAVPKDAASLVGSIHAYVCERVAAAYPGAVDAVRTLHARGHAMYTSTGQPSYEISGYLRALGIRDLFTKTYGTDLVDRWKNNSAYYSRILADAGISGADAVVVDDTERMLEYARRAGIARTVLIAPAGTASDHEVITSLAELPSQMS